MKELIEPPKKAIISAQDPKAELVVLQDSTASKAIAAASKKRIRQTLNREWEEAWDKHKHGRDLYKLVTRPGRRILTLHDHLHGATSSVMTQMRTGKIGLRAYLHTIDKAEIDRCDCPYGKPTVEHIVLKCRDWVEEKQQMWGGGQPCVEISKILNNPTLAVRAAKMLTRTGLLGQFRVVSFTILAYQCMNECILGRQK